LIKVDLSCHFNIHDKTPVQDRGFYCHSNQPRPHIIESHRVKLTEVLYNIKKRPIFATTKNTPASPQLNSNSINVIYRYIFTYLLNRRILLKYTQSNFEPKLKNRYPLAMN